MDRHEVTVEDRAKRLRIRDRQTERGEVGLVEALERGVVVHALSCHFRRPGFRIPPAPSRRLPLSVVTRRHRRPPTVTHRGSNVVSPSPPPRLSVAETGCHRQDLAYV